MPIQLRDARLQQLVDQMTAGGKKINEAGVKELINAAYNDDGRLSGTEKDSLRSLLNTYSDQIESPQAREKLANFNRMSNATLRDAAHRFAAEGGKISETEARGLKEIALKDGRISGNEKVTLKALLGFYSPDMEPGAKELVAGLAGVSVPTDPTGPTGPTNPTGPTPTGSILGANDPRFQTHVTASGNLSLSADAAPTTLQDTGNALYRTANLVDNLPAGKNLFSELSIDQRKGLFEQLQGAIQSGQQSGQGLTDAQATQLRSSAATNLLHLAESLPNTGEGSALKGQIEAAYLAATKGETNVTLRDSMVYNLERSAQAGSLTPTTRTESKQLFTEVAPTKPPYEDWFKNGNDTINIAWYPGQGSEGFYKGTVDMLKQKGFKPEGPEREGGPVVYSKTMRNRDGVETTFRIQVKEFNDDMFGKMNDPNFQIVGYDGHSNIGRAMRKALSNAPESDGKKLIFYGLCAGKDNIFRVRDKYPDAQVMTTFNSSYFRTSGEGSNRKMVESENFNALMETINGISERKEWTAIRSDIQNNAIPYYWKGHHALPGGMNYVTPIDTAIRRNVLDSDFDGQADALDKLANFNTFDVRDNTRTEFSPIDPGRPADQIDGTHIHTAANSINTAVNYNPLTSKYNNTGRIVGGGFYEGSPTDPVVRFEKIELNGEPAWKMNVNKHFAHMSEEALRAIGSFEWNEQIYNENPSLYENRWRDAMPWGDREKPSAADRKLMGLTLATFSLAYDMQEGFFGPHRRDNEIWGQMLEKYNLPSNLDYRPIFNLIDAEHHDYAGSPTIVNNWKKEIPAGTLGQIQ